MNNTVYYTSDGNSVTLEMRFVPQNIN